MNWDEVEVVHVHDSLGWAIYCHPGYLHSDGEWYKLTKNNEGAYSGYFSQKEEAKACIAKYKPPENLLLKDLEYGKKFRFVNAEFGRNEIRTKLDGSALPINPAWADKEHITFIINDSEPFRVCWLNESYWDKEVELV